MDNKQPKNKSRTSYFGNVKNRLGPKLPAGVSTPPQFTTRAWEVQPAPARQQPVLARPLNHIPHIRNPQLRQYYLQGTAWEVQNRPTGKQEQAAPGDKTTAKAHSGNTVFSISSQLHVNSTSSGPQTSATKTLLSPQLLVIPKEKVICESSNVDFTLKQDLKPPPETVDTSPVQPQSPSPDAEYDKLLDVEAVPLPDGQLCLLALPPECCQGESPGAMPYLKLFCRYITDRKGVVSGILLVTPHKLFFDPCKSHPLVKEHGCEEYLVSCSVDSLASVSFYHDISHVHFNPSQQRRKGRTIFQKFKNSKSQTDHHPSHMEEAVAGLVSAALPASSDLSHGGDGGDGGDREVCGGEEEETQSRDMAEAEKELDRGLLDDLYEPTVGTVLSSAATFCCGGQEATSHLNMEEEEFGKGQRTVDGVALSGGPGRLMFVRLRAQLPPGKRKGVQLGSVKTLPTRDAWFALSQESSDELYAYLTQCRPDLCILEGQEEDEGDEEFVLIQDKEQEEEDIPQRQLYSGDDWEMVLMEDSGEKPTLVMDREPEGIPSIVERSHILEVSHVKELCKELPPRTVGHNWSLTYSTSRDGASLKSLYRRASASDSPALVLIKDALDEVFGAFLSHPLRPSETFYGTGETFLFMLHPRFKSFRWTGENSFFIKGDLDSFAIGGGSGHFGLWVDENLYLGRSSPCYTFNNCCLSETDDFRIMELEVWTFS